MADVTFNASRDPFVCVFILCKWLSLLSQQEKFVNPSSLRRAFFSSKVDVLVDQIIVILRLADSIK